MQSNAGKWYEIGKRAVEGVREGVNIENYHIMSEQEAKDVIINDPNGNILKRMMAIAVARSILGENCTMKEIWKWAEGNVEEVTVRVKTCFECTAYVDIDGEQSRCGLDRDPLKCDRKMAL